MTRFARRGFDNRKLNEATPWAEMRKGPKNGRVQRWNFQEQRREERRLKRQAEREAKNVCYNCRNPGHKMSDCPFLTEANQQGTCFKCGSTEHTASSCSVKIPKGSFPFAQCFICGEKGHISKQCPDNPRGLYPKGGSCKQCGSVEHLKRDCPEFLKRRGITEITVDTLGEGQSADAEPIASSSKVADDDTSKKKKNKVVKF
ncbi:zinc finger CCHC domain-containing protein 9 [Aplysia californica]|uniref:Zinc finger CCHC domain-containing protein 9 n=1 Tax=Aplysia californica TaxID=6500 RepID=A0ABM0K1R5_APLCA|nr:zinc finger CCHC domain-containing protein 9 [Aplysia californica]XP_005106700.1 zinc finger CCHC domain-containing protein 9 [Aplysia californica]XP_005106701.1 zinc finger CCHC domain-containing protein 9 [Aplysia californica]